MDVQLIYSYHAYSYNRNLFHKPNPSFRRTSHFLIVVENRVRENLEAYYE